jgi:hypothetical protein
MGALASDCAHLSMTAQLSMEGYVVNPAALQAQAAELRAEAQKAEEGARLARARALASCQAMPAQLFPFPHSLPTYSVIDPAAHSQSITCGNCCFESSIASFCYSCANTVCNKCMATGESCCLSCLSAFPVYKAKNIVCKECMATGESCCLSCLSASVWNAIPKDMSYQGINEETPLSHERVAAHSKPGSWQKEQQDNPFSKQVTPDTPSRWTSSSERGDVEVAGSRPKWSDWDVAGSTDISEDASSLRQISDMSEADLESSSTMMVCGLPCRLEDRDVVAAIKSVGFAGKYEFVYLPQRRRNNKRSGNMGYAFVHFSRPETAKAFAEAIQNFKFQRTTSTKSIVVKPAHIQRFDGRFARPDGEARVADCRSATGSREIAEIA